MGKFHRSFTNALGFNPTELKSTLCDLHHFWASPFSFAWLVAFSATTGIPGLTRAIPFTTISSPAFNPERTTRIPSIVGPSVTGRYSTVLVADSVSTNFSAALAKALDNTDWKPDRLFVVGKGDRERLVQVSDKARAAVHDYLQLDRA